MMKDAKKGVEALPSFFFWFITSLLDPSTSPLARDFKKVLLPNALLIKSGWKQLPHMFRSNVSGTSSTSDRPTLFQKSCKPLS